MNNAWLCPDGSVVPFENETERSHMARHGGDTPDFELAASSLAAIELCHKHGLFDKLLEIAPLEDLTDRDVRDFMTRHGFKWAAIKGLL